jgi:fluoride exporter
MKIALIIGAGGFIGSIGRYLLQQLVHQKVATTFPLGTMIVNIVGCLIIGIIYALSEKGNVLTPEWRMFLATGLCGGFTTFSTFSYESLNLLRDGQFLYVGLYVGLSVILGIAATWLGVTLIKTIA